VIIRTWERYSDSSALWMAFALGKCPRAVYVWLEDGMFGLYQVYKKAELTSATALRRIRIESPDEAGPIRIDNYLHLTSVDCYGQSDH
jgi:hypothetical protein